MITLPAKADIIAVDRANATVALAKNSAGTLITSIRTRVGYRAFLCFVGEAWDASIDTYVTWRVRKDGATIFELNDTTIQLSPPEAEDRELTPWHEVPEGCLVDFTADLSNAAGVPAGGGNVTARLKIYYAQKKPSEPR